MWEHFVLNEIHAATQSRSVYYWRDKQKHELDFIWAPRGHAPLAVECKWAAKEFEPGNLRVFRRDHPKGENVVVAHDVDRPFKRTFDELTVHFENTDGLVKRLL
jgi:hypothetical protein